MATNRTKQSVSKTAKKAVVKTAPKAAAKKNAAKTAPPKKVAKPAVKTAKKVLAKTAAKAKAPAKAPVKSPFKAALKTVSKSPVKKSAAKKTAAKAKTASTKKPLQKPVVKAASAPTPKVSAPVKSPISLKGLRVSGDKAARIAQIVAESFLNKANADAKVAAVDTAASAAQTSAANDPGSALDAAHKAAAVLFSKKAEEVVLMDLRNLSTVADYYLIATCSNEPQMRAILGTVQRSLSRKGIKALRSEYMPGVRWAVIDYGDMIVHLFEKQTRGFYSLERLWADAPSTLLKATDYALPADEDGQDADEDGDL